MPHKLAIVLGSKSDTELGETCAATCAELGIEYEQFIISAHRDPQKLDEFCAQAHEKYFAIVAIAGLSAALPGAIAARVTLPVIGVPAQSGALNGFDALLSIAQMPAGVPVACVAIGKTGAKNAAYLAQRFLSLLK